MALHATTTSPRTCARNATPASRRKCVHKNAKNVLDSMDTSSGEKGRRLFGGTETSVSERG